MHPTLRALAESRLGVFTAADAQRAGYQHPEIRRLLSSGRWVRLRRGIYVTADDLTRASPAPPGDTAWTALRHCSPFAAPRPS